MSDRWLWIGVLLAILGVLLLNSHPAYAADDVTEAAVAAGVNVEDLAGAINSQPGVSAWQYLRFEGKLPPLAPPEPAYGVWDRLAACESTSRWSINTGNGYFGGLQQDMTFWRNYGGPAFASRPDLATRAQQITVAIRGQAKQGWQAWPRCSRLIGLR